MPYKLHVFVKYRSKNHNHNCPNEASLLSLKVFINTFLFYMYMNLTVLMLFKFLFKKYSDNILPLKNAKQKFCF